MSEPLKILSLGAGVQSSTVFLMSCYGEIERIDHAIFADTGYESRRVYEWLEFLKTEGARCEIPVHVVKNRDLKTDALNGQVRGLKANGVRWASLPYFTLDRVTGSKGMIRRQCTDEYKIRPVKYKIREILGKGRRERIKAGTVELWKGISMDECQRATVSDVKWQTHYYPLIEIGMDRRDCLAWFERRGLPRPPRSSCLCCPFHSDDEWRLIKNESPEEWEDVVAFDHAIRKCGGMRGDVFLHKDRIPLDEVDLRTAEEAGQLHLFRAAGFATECAGVCGVLCKKKSKGFRGEDMQTTIQINGIKEVQRMLSTAPKQAGRAVEITIDQTVKIMRDDVKSEIVRVFDKPVPWTKNSVKAAPTKGHNMTGSVGLKQPERMQQHYLVPQVIGGARHLKGFELAAGGKQYDLGVGAKRTAAGNITVGQAKEVVAAAGKRKPDHVTIKAGNKQGLMPGIYQRVKTTKGFGRAVNRAATRTLQKGRRRGRFVSAIQARGLKPILIERQNQGEQVKPRLDFYGVAHDTYKREFARRFKENLARQMAGGR